MEHRTRSAVYRTQWLLAGIALLALLLSGGPAGTLFAQPVELPKSGLQLGQLTGKSDSSAEIGGRAYAFHPKVQFASEEGNQMEWKDFKKGDRVQYRLKGERIDFLVLLLPQ